MQESHVIKNAIIVTMNSKNEIIENGSIVVEGNKIRDIGLAADISRKYKIKKVIDASGMVAMPELINGHIHVITSLYKGTMTGFGFERTVGEDTALAFRSTPEIMLSASHLAAAEMLLSGTTLANVATDAITFEVSSQTAEALGQAGMKAFVQTAIADIFGPTDFSADAQIAEAEKLLQEYRGKFDGRIHVSLGPVADVTTSLKTMQTLAKLAKRNNLTVHIHVFPRWPMGIFSLMFRGHSPLGLLKAGGLLNKRLIAVHFLAAKNGDIKKLAAAGASMVHCPSVWMNAAIVPKHWMPIKTLHRAGANIALGTDSFGGWIEGSDMFTEMRNCILMSNFLYGAGSLKPADILRMATINGARVLGLGNEIGSLEIGKRADIILVRFDRPPVQTVIIDGKIIVQNRELLTIGEHKTLEMAMQAREELYGLAGWKSGHEGMTPPESSWLERYPNKQIAKWGARFARLQKRLSKAKKIFGK